MLVSFAIRAAGVVPSGDCKKSLCTLSIVQIIFQFGFFEISEDILRNIFRFIFLTDFKYMYLESNSTSTSHCVDCPH